MLKFCLLIGMMIAPVQKKVPLPHGMTFGQKVDQLQGMPAEKLETYMGKKIRISTTITGKVIAVDTQKGGWFRMDAGGGKVIGVHFREYKITIPKELKGRTVVIQGVAQRQLTTDDTHHATGDTQKGKKPNQIKTAPKQKLTFEASGLMVD